MIDSMQTKAQRRPVIDPLLLILKSRRVLIALVALIIGLLVTAVPELAAVQDELLVLLITMALAVIGGYSVEDAALAGRNYTTAQPSDQELHELVKLLLNQMIDVAVEADPDKTE